MEIKELKLNQIDADKNQPRKKFKDIGELASNILKEGLLEPLKVIKNKNKYLLIDGERRFRALQLLNKASGGDENIARCIILKRSRNRTITQLSTDIHKHKLDPFEEAECYKELIESGFSIKDLEMRLGKKRPYLIRRLKLLSFSPFTRKKVQEGRIPMSIIDKIDIDTIKEKEDIIMERIENEASNSQDIKNIIDEETYKYEYRINSFIREVESFSKAVGSFSYYIKNDIKDAKLGDAKLGDAMKDCDRLIYNLSKFDKIRKDTTVIKSKLDRLYKRFGKKHTVEIKELTSSNPKTQTNTIKNNHNPQIKPSRVGLEDGKQGSLDTTGDKEFISAQMPKDNTGDALMGQEKKECKK